MKRFSPRPCQIPPLYALLLPRLQLKNEVAGSFLNWLWWILDPLLFMLVYTFVYSIVFGRSQDYLCAFIFLGYCSWEFFNRSVKQSVKLVKKYKSVLSKVYLPKFILIISSMLVNGFKMLISLGIVVITMAVYRIPPSLTMLWAIPFLLLLFLLTFGFSCWLLHFGVFSRTWPISSTWSCACCSTCPASSTTRSSS